MKTPINKIKRLSSLLNEEKDIEANPNQRISSDISLFISVLSNYIESDIIVSECIDEINKMSEIEIKDFVDSISANHPSSNSLKENFMMDIINTFNLLKI